MPSIKKNIKLRGCNRHSTRTPVSIIRTSNGKMMINGPYAGLRIKNRGVVHNDEFSHLTSVTRKKMAQLGSEYVKIYNRELKDIDLIATGLARFKK